jgi:hypothetical protein
VRSSEQPAENITESLEGIRTARELRTLLLSDTHPHWKIISLVRDPVARNISAFFYNLKHHVPGFFETNFYKGKFYATQAGVDKLTDIFLRRLNHSFPLRWFDAQLRDLIDIDVFATPFPHGHGFAIYQSDKFDVLLMRTEDINRVAGKAISTFLEIDNFQVNTTNKGDQQAYADLYQSFLSLAHLPPDYLDEIYASQLVSHFYTQAEVEKFRTRWLN